MGSGGGGGSAHTPYEAPNTLQSAQRLKVVDILCEGPIKSDVSLKNILLDGTPIQNDDGSYNFQGVDVSYLAGHHTQSTLKGFEQVSKVISVGAEVKHSTPITRSVTDPLVDSVRVVLTLGSLLNMKDNGDRVGGTVELLVTAGNRRYPVTITGKTTSSYNQDVLITDLPEVPFNITVERITLDATTQNTSDKTYWNVYVENTDTKFTYPDTVVVGLSIDSAQFGGKVPTRTYLTDWQMVQIPANYDPKTRKYDGIWDGTFKYDWTDNPAWLMYDLITNKRYGLGERVGNACDKWSLYEIAKYCDQIVPDGFGGHEPRFTCNVCIDDQRDAYALLDDLASCFRGIPIWDGTQVTFAIDSKKDPVALFSNSNVVDGTFEYASSELKTIYTAAHVQYVDKENGYKKTTEYVADDEAIARYGLNVKQFTAFGCTSRGQAARAGKWMIETSIRERQSVSFKTGMQGFCLLPWDIIQIADADYAGEQIHGRIENIEDTLVTIDRELAQNSVGASFHYYTQDGMQHRTIEQINGKVLTLNESPEGAEQLAVFGVAKEQLKPRLFRVIGIKEDEGVFSVSAIQHDPNKEAIVDNGMTFTHHSQATKHTPVLYATTINKTGDDLVVAWQGMNATAYSINRARSHFS
ncbi:MULTISPECIES: host specificity protein J [Pasteurellaceae]|uniref:Phage tail protein n=1 Tax=Pasteurella atlantica TaxID=2827233 RepID=A0AAW8CHZ3_9PAST|nr:phage tail protein [Pasteurella atlantica]MBR0573676.1 host specificity protein J [Pasteurella atlantica]MDP8039691.1 phage tail protein [Pasteurella atlantica]MDP8041782.1 phage tail protein [Pasteurella atlantica]MDP8043944.1 phage tail protein [Pasteurella atlantica]MDP8045922.1 phage tail protein [Pasteurella atlantica]